MALLRSGMSPAAAAVDIARWSRDQVRAVRQLDEVYGWRGRRPRQRPDWYLDRHARNFSPGLVLGGASRSGTTLVRVMLDSHPDLACGPESALFLPKFNEGQLHRWFDVSRAEIRAWEREAATYPDFVARFLLTYAQRQGKSHWAEKSPRNVLNVGWILDRFPNVTFCHIVRDGRAVVNSLRTHPRFRAKRGQLVATGIVNDLDNCIDQWLTEVGSGLAFSGHPRVLEVRYEDVVADQEAALTPILARMGLSWSPAMRDYHQVKAASREVTRVRQNPEVTEPLKPSSLAKWKEDLSAEQVSRIEDRARRELTHLGYL